MVNGGANGAFCSECCLPQRQCSCPDDEDFSFLFNNKKSEAGHAVVEGKKICNECSTIIDDDGSCPHCD